MRCTVFRALLMIIVAVSVLTERLHSRECPVATFSIVAYDSAAEEWGVAVQSKFLGVGVGVPWARAGVGAIATQAWANTDYGPEGLALLKMGIPGLGTL